MTIWQLLTSDWNWNPWILLICVALLVIYLAVMRFQLTKYALSFMAGTILLFLSLLFTIGMLGHNYLFSAHMLQHVLLLLIVPLLLLVGFPSPLIRKALSWSPFGNLMRVLGYPLVAWFSGISAMWFWHMPHVYNAALDNETLHIVQQLSLLILGTIFWWPVFAHVQERRLTPPFATLYLFSACIGCTILGIIITFSAVVHYPAYLNPVDSLGILPFIRDELYLTPELDQQIGGLIMWVPCCLIYLLASMITIARWYKTPEVDVMTSEPLSSVNSIKAS